MRYRLSECVGAALLSLVVLSPTSVHAAPAEDDVMAEAKRLYEDGRAKYDTVDYEGAIGSWTQAYGMLPEDEVQVRSALAYNIAAAREKRFELNGDLLELKRARILLIKYVGETKSIMQAGPELDELVQGGEERIAKIDERLEAEEAKAAASPPPVEKKDPPADATSPTDSTGPADNAIADDPGGKDSGGNGGNKGMLYAGVGVAAAGVAAFGVAGAFMATGGKKNGEVTSLADDEMGRLAAISAGQKANTLAIALGATAGVLIAGGAVLIALGLKKKGEPKNASLVPTVGPGQAGVVFMGRF